MSRHRTRPPNYGPFMRSRLNVVDNSQLAKAALSYHRLPMIVSVLRQGYRQRHMPKARLGDRCSIAICGEVRHAIVVGHNLHKTQRRHGVASTDTTNVVLVGKDGTPLGTRIMVPVPSALRALRSDPTIAKVLAIATSFV